MVPLYIFARERPTTILGTVGTLTDLVALVVAVTTLKQPGGGPVTKSNRLCKHNNNNKQQVIRRRRPKVRAVGVSKNTAFVVRAARAPSMAKKDKTAKKPLKKETIEKAKPSKLKSLAKGRVNGFGKSADDLRKELMQWCEENGGFA